MMTNEQMIFSLETIIANAKEYESSSMDDDFLCYDYLLTDVEDLLKELRNDQKIKFKSLPVCENS